MDVAAAIEVGIEKNRDGIWYSMVSDVPPAQQSLDC